METSTTSGDNNFHLSEMNPGFLSRSNDVFSCLDSIEEKHKAFERNNQCEDQSSFLKADPIEEPIVCKSLFKMPRSIPKKFRVPDYKLRPEKWKMYDLSNISADQLSETSNRKTAWSFIDRLKKNDDKSSEIIEETEEDMNICADGEVNHSSFASDKQHLFKKPVRQIKADSEIEMDDNFQSNKVSSVSTMQLNSDRDIEEVVQDKNESSDVSKMLSDDVHFHRKQVKGRKTSIRPKCSNDDGDDQELSGSNPSIEDLEDKQKTSETDFSEDDHQEINDSDEEDDMGSEFGHAWSKPNRKVAHKKDSEDQSDDEDVLKRAEEFAALDQSSCIILGEKGNCEDAGTNGDNESLDDLDDID